MVVRTAAIGIKMVVHETARSQPGRLSEVYREVILMAIRT